MLFPYTTGIEFLVTRNKNYHSSSTLFCKGVPVISNLFLVLNSCVNTSIASKTNSLKKMHINQTKPRVPIMNAPKENGNIGIPKVLCTMKPHCSLTCELHPPLDNSTWFWIAPPYPSTVLHTWSTTYQILYPCSPSY